MIKVLFVCHGSLFQESSKGSSIMACGDFKVDLQPTFNPGSFCANVTK